LKENKTESEFHPILLMSEDSELQNIGKIKYILFKDKTEEKVYILDNSGKIIMNPEKMKRSINEEDYKVGIEIIKGYSNNEIGSSSNFRIMDDNVP